MRQAVSLPESFQSRIIAIHGEGGRAWLAGLEQQIESLQARWHIRVGDAFPTIRYNFVAPAQLADGTPAVLKLSVPGKAVLAEAACLAACAGRGAPRLLEHAADIGALLMIRILPGTNLINVDENHAIEAALAVMAELHRAVIPRDALPHVNDWGRGFERYRARFNDVSGPLPRSILRQAEGMFEALASTMDQEVLLHGDLHHENILRHGSHRWTAIDPQGVVGERAYEAGAFLRNPMPDMLQWPDLNDRLAFRISSLAAGLDVDRQRIAGWGFAQAVLSAVWSIEDEENGWEAAFKVASVLRELCQ